MEHEFSIFYHPVNALLVALLGRPSARWEQAFGIVPGEPAWLPDNVIMALFILVAVTVLLLQVRRRLSLEKPSALQQSLELFVSGMRSMTEDVVGHGRGKDFVAFITALGVFIFLSNICSLVFFLAPPTAYTSTTFALSITAFLYYNAVGLKRNGPIGYARQFVGPVWWLFPLMIPLEIISHLARILSLALRLFGNIFAEHTAISIFIALVPFVVPWAMMSIDILGATIQAFIFIILTAVYIAGAVAEEH